MNKIKSFFSLITYLSKYVTEEFIYKKYELEMIKGIGNYIYFSSEKINFKIHNLQLGHIKDIIYWGSKAYKNESVSFKKSIFGSVELLVKVANV